MHDRKDTSQPAISPLDRLIRLIAEIEVQRYLGEVPKPKGETKR